MWFQPAGWDDDPWMRKSMSFFSCVTGRAQISEAADQRSEGPRGIAESSSGLSDGAQSQAASAEELNAQAQGLRDLVRQLQL